MADLKISQLTAISVLTPATDVLPVVDVGGVTKKITTNQILGSGGTATLASATITGDLTVDTSTLKVDSTNDVVGIGTTTPNSYAFNDPAKLVIANTGTAGAGNTFTIASGSTGFGQIAFANGTSGTSRYNGYIKYSHSTNAMEFYTTAGALQATLNSTGLGIGVASSGGRLVVRDAGGNDSYFGLGATNDIYLSTGATGSHYFRKAAASAAMTLDASGKLLVGSTSAFTTLSGSFEVKIGDGGIQTFSSAITAATATSIARSGFGGMVSVTASNATGQYSAAVIFTSASATVVSVINGTGSVITFGVVSGNLQITSSLALTNCIAQSFRNN